MTARDRAREKWRAQPFAERTPETGVCNTRFEDSYCPPTPLRSTLSNAWEPRIGVDTVSWGWSDGEAVDRFLRLDGLVPDRNDPRPLRVVPSAGGAVRLNRRLDGLGTVGAFPGASLLFVEGRARALERRDETDHGLGRVGTLSGVQQQVGEDLGQLLGQSLAAPGGLRRADLAGELAWTRGEDGRQFLWLLDQLHSPNHKTSPVREKGGSGVETAYWRTARRSIPVLRAYDKGIESATAAPGERIRVERQLRYGSGKRPTMKQWLSRDLADLYTTPLRGWLRGGVVAGTATQLLRLLTDAAVIWPSYWASGCCWASTTGGVHCSMWPARKVERVIGTLAVVDVYGKAWPAWSPKQRQRRLAEVRDLGLLLTDRPVTIDVDQAITSLCDLWRAAA